MAGLLYYQSATADRPHFVAVKLQSISVLLQPCSNYTRNMKRTIKSAGRNRGSESDGIPEVFQIDIFHDAIGGLRQPLDTTNYPTLYSSEFIYLNYYTYTGLAWYIEGYINAKGIPIAGALLKALIYRIPKERKRKEVYIQQEVHPLKYKIRSREPRPSNRTAADHGASQRYSESWRMLAMHLPSSADRPLGCFGSWHQTPRLFCTCRLVRPWHPFNVQRMRT